MCIRDRNIDDQQFMEMIASPVINPGGNVVQVVAVVWDATGTRRLQQKIDAIDKAGRELVKLEAESLSKMNVGQRLKLLEDKIISFTRDLIDVYKRQFFDSFPTRSCTPAGCTCWGTCCFSTSSGTT